MYSLLNMITMILFYLLTVVLVTWEEDSLGLALQGCIGFVTGNRYRESLQGIITGIQQKTLA